MVSLVGLARDNMENFPPQTQKLIIEVITQAFLVVEKMRRWEDLNQHLKALNLQEIVKTIDENKEQADQFKLHFASLLPPDSDLSKIRVHSMKLASLPHVAAIDLLDFKEFQYGTIYYDTLNKKLLTTAQLEKLRNARTS